MEPSRAEAFVAELLIIAGMGAASIVGQALIGTYNKQVQSKVIIVNEN